MEEARGKRQAALAEEADLGQGAVHTGSLRAVDRGNGAQEEEEGKRQAADLATDLEEGMERAAPGEDIDLGEAAQM